MGIIKLPKSKPAKRLRPNILCSSGIPLPLSQVNPRNIKGRVWWKKQRDKVIKANNYCCYACGVSMQSARYKQQLECHEIFTINYTKKLSTFREIVALCHLCHNVVHIKRLAMLTLAYKSPWHKLIDVINHGTVVLKAAGLADSYQLQFVKLVALKELSPIDAKKLLEYRGVTKQNRDIDEETWLDWRMKFEGEYYPPKFKSPAALKDYYTYEDE